MRIGSILIFFLSNIFGSIFKNSISRQPSLNFWTRGTFCPSHVSLIYCKTDHLQCLLTSYSQAQHQQKLYAFPAAGVMVKAQTCQQGLRLV